MRSQQQYNIVKSVARTVSFKLARNRWPERRTRKQKVAEGEHGRAVREHRESTREQRANTGEHEGASREQMDETGLSARAERRGLSQRAVTYCLRFGDCRFRSGKGAGPLLEGAAREHRRAQREQRGALIEHRGSTRGNAGPIGYGVFT